MFLRSKPSLVALAAVGCLALTPSLAGAGYIVVNGGPVFNPTTQTGYQGPDLPVVPGSTAGNGVAVGAIGKYAGGVYLGARAFRWNMNDSAMTELGNLGVSSAGSTDVSAFAINPSGTAVGFAYQYVSGITRGCRAVRWDASVVTATELGNLGVDSGGNCVSIAYAINASGTTVGRADKYLNGTSLGSRAVRWEAGGTVATELGNLGTDSAGNTASIAYAVNSSGTAVGYANKYAGGVPLGSRAVRWDAGAITATELGHLGVDGSGVTSSFAFAVNPAGTAVGYAYKYTGGVSLGVRAVRWDAGATTATELGNLGTDSAGTATSRAYAINAAGTTVGYVTKFMLGANLGYRAVRWDAGSTTATELGNLGTSITGVSDSAANAINSAGVAVGYAKSYIGGVDKGSHAVLWNANSTTAIDLNSLIDPGSGWTLEDARGISDTNWVTGIGTFDPDGEGPLTAYSRAFLIDVSSAVPEPATAGLLAIAGMGLLPRRRRADRDRP